MKAFEEEEEETAAETKSARKTRPKISFDIGLPAKHFIRKCARDHLMRFHFGLVLNIQRRGKERRKRIKKINENRNSIKPWGADLPLGSEKILNEMFEKRQQSSHTSRLKAALALAKKI